MKLYTRQVCFIIFAYTAVTKILLYPTLLANQCGRDLLFPALIDFTVQGIVIWAVSYLCSKTDKTFYALLKDTLGDITARIIFGFFALFFISATVIPLCEHRMYVHTIFYDTLPALLVFLPFFFFSVYAGSKSFSNIGRCADICLPLFVFSVIAVFTMSLTEVQWDNLLPVLKTPAKTLFLSSLGSLYRFAEPCYILMFMGRFKYNKGDAARITVSYAGGAAIVLLFLAVFYGVYGGLAPSVNFAVAKTSIFFPAIDVIGRIDLIVLYVLEIVMLFALALNIQLAVYCLKVCTGREYGLAYSLAVNALLLAVLVVFNNAFNILHNVYVNWMWIVFVLFAILIPLLAWAMKRRER